MRDTAPSCRLLPPPPPQQSVCDTRGVFDGMPPGSEEDDRVPMEAGGEDRISALPAEIIHCLLGFLPAPEAVRTSLLARRWRYHWKSMRCLRLTVIDGPVQSAEWLNQFMGHLLRGLNASLDVCDIHVRPGHCSDVTELDGYRWIRQIVSKHHARELIFDRGFVHEMTMVQLGGKPLVSSYLMKLKLYYVELRGMVLDFSRCPALEELVLFACDIVSAKEISSQSLKRLRIKHCEFFVDSRTHISVPNLIYLNLMRLKGASPMLESMPFLETAKFSLRCNHYDDQYRCNNSGSRKCCGLCEGCIGNEDHSGGCELLGGLSSATHLELNVPFAKFTDTTCYPTFLKLKTLLLNEWCLAADFRALIGILQCSPVLEKLTIQLNKGHENTTELDGNENPGAHLASVSQNLKLVKVKCFEVDQRVSKISKLFRASDIPIIME